MVTSPRDDAEVRRDAELEADLETRFTYHAPSDRQVLLYQDIRSAGHAFATLVAGHAPDSRERSLALTKIDEAVMWANAAIARRS